MKKLVYIFLTALLAIIFFMPICQAGTGEKKDIKSRKDSVRALYVKSYPDFFYIKPLFSTRSLSLNLKNKINGERQIKYLPNGNRYGGVGLYVFGIGLEASLKLPDEVSESTTTFGETEIFDFQANIYSRRVGVDLAYQKYRGFYIDNPQRHFTSWQKGDDFPQRSDLSFSNIFANAFYMFNNNSFSFRSAYNQADRQLRSKGSFLLFGTLSKLEIEADSSLVPNVISEEFGNAKGLQAAGFTTFGVMPGYAHNFVIKKFYLNASLSLGAGYQWIDYVLDGLNKEDRKVQFTSTVRGGLGYNGDRFFSGVTFFLNNVPSNIENLEIAGISGNVKLFVGYRFEEFGVLKKKIFNN